MDDVNPAGMEALRRWDKLMAGVGELTGIIEGVSLAVAAAHWFQERLRERQDEQRRIAASEMFAQKRDHFLRLLIEAREAEDAARTPLEGLSDDAAKELLRKRATIPTAEQLARWWVLTGRIPVVQRAPGVYVTLDAITIEIEIRRMAAPRESAPLDSQAALLNLLLALRLTPDEAERVGHAELLLQWNRDRARRLLPQEAELRDAVLRARQAERDEPRALSWRIPGPADALRRWALGYLRRRRPPLQTDVATWWSLTGAAPDPAWNRGRIERECRRLERIRGVPVQRAAALERLCDLLQLPKIEGRPMAAPASDPGTWRHSKTISYAEPDYASVDALTPWPNERTAIDPAAADRDFAPEIRSRAYKPAMRGETPIGDRFLGADGWYYLFLPELPARGGRRGRIVMRRGKFYDEFPVWLVSEDVRTVWDQLREKRALPVELSREMSAALCGNEEALHDFWRVVGYNPPGHVVGVRGREAAPPPGTPTRLVVVTRFGRTAPRGEGVALG